MTPLRIGLLGAAKIAPEAVIYPAQVVPAVAVTAVAARDGERAAEFARRHHIPGHGDDYQALVNSVDVDLVYVALPVSHHAQWCIAALNAGKDVLCEKPFAMNAREAQAVLDAAAANGRRVIEAFHYRHHPAFETCLRWLREGAIGELLTVSGSFCAPVPLDGQDIRSIPALGGGAMMDLGCYPLHWIDELTDGRAQVEGATATLCEYGVDQRFEVSFTFGAAGRAALNTAMGQGTAIEIDLLLEGREGQIRFRNPLAPHRGATLSCEGPRPAQAPISLLSTYSYQLADLAAALRSGAPLRNEGARILRQQQMLDRCYAAAGLGALRHSTAFADAAS